MRVLNLSLDTQILEKDSAVQKRLIALAEKVGNTTPALADSGTPFLNGGITVFVPGVRDERQELSAHLTIYSFGGLKLMQLFKM